MKTQIFEQYHGIASIRATVTQSAVCLQRLNNDVENSKLGFLYRADFQRDIVQTMECHGTRFFNSNKEDK